ncbi:hypothetical protein [Rosenbergiella metrosideri]|nr:hypothetical protein [Rosenbergiella metrosideri]
MELFAGGFLIAIPMEMLAGEEGQDGIREYPQQALLIAGLFFNHFSG